jgi:uncharacterized protein (TIGR02246 family)
MAGYGRDGRLRRVQHSRYLGSGKVEKQKVCEIRLWKQENMDEWPILQESCSQTGSWLSSGSPEMIQNFFGCNPKPAGTKKHKSPSMKNSIRILTIVALTLFVGSFHSGCSGGAEGTPEAMAESEYDMATARTEIEAANSEFSNLLAAGDSVGLANLYTEDAKFMMNGAPAVVGRQNIQSVLSTIMQSGITRVDLRTVEVWGDEDMVVEEGELTLFAGEESADEGKYMVLWKKVDGNWKLFRDIFNSDLSPE